MRQGPHAAEIPKLSRRKSNQACVQPRSTVTTQPLQRRHGEHASHAMRGRGGGAVAVSSVEALRSTFIPGLERIRGDAGPPAQQGTRPLGIRVDGVRPSVVLTHCRAHPPQRKVGGGRSACAKRIGPVGYARRHRVGGCIPDTSTLAVARSAVNCWSCSAPRPG